MAIVQISKIQVRTGAESDLPQLDIGELGFATDTKNTYIGNDPILDPPVGIKPTLTQILTDSPNCHINAGQITGILNIKVSDIKITGGYNGYVLKTDGTGNLSWAAGSGGGGGSVAGSDTQIQFNDAGYFNGVANLTFDKTSNTLTTDNLIVANVTGTLLTASQTNITTVGTLKSLTVANTGSTGNILSDNANLGNLVTANYFSGNGSLLTSITATTAGTVTTSSQPNITSVGTLSTLTVSGVTTLGNVSNVRISNGNPGQVLTTDGAGNLSWATVSGGGGTVYGNTNVASYLNSGFFNTTFVGSIPNATHATIADSANAVTGANVSGQVSNALIAGTVYTAAQPNITSIGTLASLSVTGTVNAGNILATNIGNSTSVIYGNGRQLSSLAGSNVTGVVANAQYAVSAGTAGAATTATWSGISGTPTTVSGYGITDVYGPAFIATFTVSTGLPTTAGAIQEIGLIYNNILKNINNGYSNGDGFFTAPRAGFYQVNASISATPSNWSTVNNYGSQAALALSKNNTKIALGNFVTMITQTINSQLIQVIDASSVSDIVYLNIGDTISCSFFYSTNAPANFWNLLSTIPGSFSACWLRP